MTMSSSAAQNPESVKLRSIFVSTEDKAPLENIADTKEWTCHNEGKDAKVDKEADSDNDYVEEPIMLPQSTHTFLFTEDISSLPFWFAFSTAAISLTCLVLALQNSLCGSSTNNVANVPVQVLPAVKVAQYISIFIGLLTEEEIPTGLYMLRMISQQSLKSKFPQMKFWKFVFSAMVRLTLGYAFLFNMFIIIVQSDAVIDIFYDLLALQFVQQLDDIAFQLCKKEAFGDRLSRAASKKCFHAEFQRQHFLGRLKKIGIFLKMLYFCNLALAIMGLTYITLKQRSGDYQAISITVTFGDELWEKAVVENVTGRFYEHDLIFSMFNGVYVQSGGHDGRPVYVEQRKFEQTPYEKWIGAEIKYCRSESRWVLTHSNIRKSLTSEKSDCDWIFRSPETTDYNLLDVSGSWSAWTGKIVHDADIFIIDNECESESDCNLNGVCLSGQCLCDSSYFGAHCEYREPCPVIKGDQNDTWGVVYFDDGTFFSLYDRPVYVYTEGYNGTSPPGENDALIIVYTGSRYFGFYYAGLRWKDLDFWIEFAKDYHPFWDPFVSETYFITDPTTSSTPVGLDIFFVTDRGERYKPFGKLIPYSEVAGSGYFSCFEAEDYMHYRERTDGKRLLH